MRAHDDATLLYLIKQVELAVRSRLDDVADGHGLTALQYTALTVLERHPGMTSSELARNSFVRPQTMAQMITYLLQRGFVRREPDARSRRQILIFLTDEGQAVLNSLREPVRDLEKAMVSGLTEAGARQLGTSLRACRIALGGGAAH
ncbi:MAG TPA: MarR family transcriptional regulator [Cellulomonas sp.]|uniref:MarR family winged helix-turn-helix transcriptional regulator n=1 Tax=Cellulomonas sp. TaxID=40001 RepID=UPI002E30D1B5|nr:MarR family transcriptional regulator [Cellulomonas sp.]HEX5332210.1 MarR family transcriptional regulator [Cellulomonas sp.]